MDFFGKVLNGTPGQPGYKFKPGRTLLCGAFITCVIVGAFALPIIGIAGGPDIYWNHQMKDSCKGYDTRVAMGNVLPRSKYDFHSLDASVEDRTFYLAPIFAPQNYSNANFQYYHRFSGSSANTANIAIDVDIDQGVWRVMHLNGPDERTRWLAVGRKDRHKTVPTFYNVKENMTLSGTISWREGHMVLPGYNGIVIQGVNDAVEHQEIEPFLRVMDTRTPNKTEIDEAYTQKLLKKNWNWSPKFDDHVIMRAASFGLGRQRLDMCLRENIYFDGDGVEMGNRGIHDDSLVPFAIYAANRMRMAELKLLDGAKARDSNKGRRKKADYEKED